MPRDRTNQANWWISTIPHHYFVPYLPPGIAYIRGQLELSETGYLHWQFVSYVAAKKQLVFMRSVFGVNGHHEPTRSSAAVEYCWKEDTRVDGSQFELGTRPFRRNSSTDWEAVLLASKSGHFESIPADVLVRHYGSIKRIRADYLVPVCVVREVFVFWGRTGTGKSRRAWEQAGMEAYPKDPLTKFWDGYQAQEHVVLDEFRGIISIGHVLRWFDRYPVRVEVKGSSAVLVAKKIWITSNMDPRDWYPDLDDATKSALLRRLQITHFDAL